MRWKSIITGLYEISGKEVPIKKIKFKTELGYPRCPLVFFISSDGASPKTVAVKAVRIGLVEIVIAA